MSEVRFCVKIDNVDKELFRIKEVKRNTELNMTFNGGIKSCIVGRDVDEFKELFDSQKVKKGNLIDKSSHITVHANKNNDKNNTIKRTIAYENDELKDITMVQVTPGMKRDNKFVPIIFRISGDLRKEQFDLKKKSNDIIEYLYDNFNQSSNQLEYMIVVSKSDTDFHFDEEHPSKVLSHKFENFNITIIYSVLNVEPLEQTISITFKTKAEDYDYLRGYEWFEIYNLYTDLKMIHYNEYFKENNK